MGNLNGRTISMAAAIVVVTFVACERSVYAQRSDDDVIVDVQHPREWTQLIDRRVVVEGLAWGSYSKGLGERVLFNADRPVYVRNVDFLKYKADGRPVRVIGMLRKLQSEKSPPNAQGYGVAFDYYRIDVERWSILDKVAHPWMQAYVAEEPQGK